MKQIIFIILSFLALTPAAISAQQYSDPVRMGWGIRANIDINVPGHFRTNGESLKRSSSFIGQQYIFYDTYRYDNIVISAEPSGDKSTVDPAVRKLGIRIPLHFGYNLDFWEKAAVAFYTGPQFDYSFYGNVSTPDDIDWGEPHSGDLFGPYNQRRFDIAWKVGLGLPMNHWYVGLEAAFGLLDLMRTDVTFHENRVSLTLGYNF